MQRSVYIDVLKAIAIIAVVLFHSGILLYGYLGVDVFFVIAGYFTTKSLKKNVLSVTNINTSGGYFQFIISRIIRLMPALLVAGTVSMIFGWFLMLPDDYENLAESVVATNFFSNNILSAITTKDYWAVVNEYKPLMHTWYVGVVMQFYLIYPILFYIAKRRKKPEQTLMTLIASLAVISLLIFFGSTNDANRFYYLPSRFFEFAVGGILALTYKPSDERCFNAVYTYVCYAVLVALIVINNEIIPDRVRLVLVVALTCVLILSSTTLSNKITSNLFLAKIGAASYSIYVWHQVILAFYRYSVSYHFTVFTYLLYLVAVALLSWCSYIFVEQGIINTCKSTNGKKTVNIFIIVIFIALNSFAGFVYLNKGVVHDIPEFNVSTSNRHRDLIKEYCDRGFLYDKPFESEKRHWFVIGNSFGRDFVNIILESRIADSVEISYTTNYDKDSNALRFEKADRVFISTLGLDETLVQEIENTCQSHGLSRERVIIVGEKDFGESNGQVYARRNRSDYFDMYVEVKDRERFIEKNEYYAQLYGDRFLNLMDKVCDDEGKVKVFTPEHLAISPDTRHVGKVGAKYFAEMIEWDKYMVD